MDQRAAAGRAGRLSQSSQISGSEVARKDGEADAVKPAYTRVPSGETATEVALNVDASAAAATDSQAHKRAITAFNRRHLRGELTPGSLIGEEQLAGDLGISRTPLREALHALLREGMLREAPRRQLIVTTVTRNRLKEVLDLRETLEQFATRRAATTLDLERIDVLRLNLIQQRRAAHAGETDRYLDLDDEFHIRLAADSNLGLTTEFLAQLRGYVRIALLGVDPAVPGWEPLAATDQHEAILDAIEQHNVDAAEALMAAHLANTRRILEQRELAPVPRRP